jgi:hypothetical protein
VLRAGNRLHMKNLNFEGYSCQFTSCHCLLIQLDHVLDAGGVINCRTPNLKVDNGGPCWTLFCYSITADQVYDCFFCYYHECTFVLVHTKGMEGHHCTTHMCFQRTNTRCLDYPLKHMKISTLYCYCILLLIPLSKYMAYFQPYKEGVKFYLTLKGLGGSPNSRNCQKVL